MTVIVLFHLKKALIFIEIILAPFGKGISFDLTNLVKVMCWLKEKELVKYLVPKDITLIR